MSSNAQGSADKRQGPRYRHAEGRESCGHDDYHDHDAHFCRGEVLVCGLWTGNWP
ncbi:hypothetical protein ACIHJG_39710 [Streptomyces sp. NPDC052415]|uniref:hypothetical protein n=1 Tax=Streptomyces sp. NPDC052415 TaxID=3365690 RepID=UPI0037D47112